MANGPFPISRSTPPYSPSRRTLLTRLAQLLRKSTCDGWWGLHEWVSWELDLHTEQGHLRVSDIRPSLSSISHQTMHYMYLSDMTPGRMNGLSPPLSYQRIVIIAQPCLSRRIFATIRSI